MACFNDAGRNVPPLGARTRTWSTASRSSVTSQSSTLSIYTKVYQSSPLAEATEGHTNAYGSFTTTMPASFWLRTHLKLNIPVSAKRQGKQRASDHQPGYDDYDYCDSPPDSPLSFFHPRSRRSPSITRTSSIDSYWEDPSSSSAPSPLTSAPPSPLMDTGHTKLHPVLEALEKGSRLSYSTRDVVFSRV
ncbi:hypothetical protein HYDPIDRAFT_30173 [Hydnomerulius pinastri MD-312]|uniref:Uncharacterized protein n=1 Tax=Hydnomerulius pinastri MD-312 TaxID=994086 RepID=A0A0C9WDK6_9AGAM|nr:hypothetical protein HYDPIDRAFT_30173 [Hydnomerulius pinastri MD-312]